MNIFDRDRIGHDVPCLVIDTSDPTAKDEYAYVRWTHATIGETVNSVALCYRSRNVKGTWLVKEVDVEPSADWIQKTVLSGLTEV